MKKVISFVLSVVILSSVLGVSGLALLDENKNYQIGDSYFTYTIVDGDSTELGNNYGKGGSIVFENNTLVIRKLSDNFSRKLVVPDEIDSVKIENVLIEDYSYLETLVLSDGIKRFACFYDQGDWEHMMLKKREPNFIKYLYLGKEFIEEGLATTKYNSFAMLENLESISVSADNPTLTSYKNAVYTKDLKKIVMFPACGKKVSSTNYKLPKKTTQIDDGAFNNVVKLTRLKGITNITKVGRAFENSSVTFAGISKNTKNIEPCTFRASKQLKRVVLFGKTKKIIGECAFENCNNLINVTIKSNKAPKVGANAFKNTKKGVRFYVKNKKIAKQLKKNLKGKGVKSAKIYANKKLVFKNVK